MSGPKEYVYLSYDYASAEEAAGILAQFSYMSGVSVSGNGSKVVVRVAGTQADADKRQKEIKKGLENAKQAYYASTEMQELLKKQQEEICAYLDKQKAQAEREYNRIKAELEKAKGMCEAWQETIMERVSTAFDNVEFDMSCEAGYVTRQLQAVQAAIEALENKKNELAANRDAHRADVKGCKTVLELKALGPITSEVVLSDGGMVQKTAVFESEMKKKQGRLEDYIKFVKDVYDFMMENGLDAYVPAVEEQLKAINVLADDAVDLLREAVCSIKKDAQLLRDKREEQAVMEAVGHSSNEQIRQLELLGEKLAEFAQTTEVAQTMSVEMQESVQMQIDECEGLLREAEKLEYYSVDKVKEFVEQINSCRNQGENEALASLIDLYTEISEWIQTCKTTNAEFVAFRTAHEAYCRAYGDLMAFVDSKAQESLREDWKNMAKWRFPCSEADCVKRLNQEAAEIRKIVDDGRQTGFQESMGEIIQQSQADNEEILILNETYGDGRKHMLYTRKGDKGVIYDAYCEESGRCVVVPRRVTLDNSDESLITQEELEERCQSCAWADALNQRMQGISLIEQEADGFKEIENPNDAAQTLYKTPYKIKDYTNSMKYLRCAGYSDEEIERKGYKRAASEKDADSKRHRQVVYKVAIAKEVKRSGS